VGDRDISEHSELATRARGGDRRAFTELIEQTKLPLYRFVRRYVGNEDDAYDIVQESFIAAWGALRRYDESRSFLTWLRSIALNKCRDHARRQAVRTKLRTLFAFTMVDRDDPFEARDADSEPRLDRLDVAIAELPAFYKEPLLLTAISGLSHKEAAAQLNTSSKAIEMRVRRARQRLEKALSPPSEEGKG
jgi:RNA polymerase sigma factor (sigma-70 family)